MVGTIKNLEGCIIGYIEWNLVNKQGQFNNNSEYLYIADIWVHEKQRWSNVFQELIRIVDNHPYAKDAKFVYWDFLRDYCGKRIFDNSRNDFNNLKQSRIYERRYIANKILKREVIKCLSDF